MDQVLELMEVDLHMYGILNFYVSQLLIDRGTIVGLRIARVFRGDCLK